MFPSVMILTLLVGLPTQLPSGTWDCPVAWLVKQIPYSSIMLPYVKVRSNTVKSPHHIDRHD